MSSPAAAPAVTPSFVAPRSSEVPPAATDADPVRARPDRARIRLALVLISLGACGTGSPPPTGDGDVTASAPAPATVPGTTPRVPDGAESVAPGPLGCDAPAAAIQLRALELIDAARAEGRSCGREEPAAVGALGWDSRLEDAARAHSADMAATGNFDHTGTDGSSAGDRIERAGYAWRAYAENIASGQETLEAAVEGWLGSPGHCRNLMNPVVSDTAVACVASEGDPRRHYWTHVLARPAEE